MRADYLACARAGSTSIGLSPPLESAGARSHPTGPLASANAARSSSDSWSGPQTSTPVRAGHVGLAIVTGR